MSKLALVEGKSAWKFLLGFSGAIGSGAVIAYLVLKLGGGYQITSTSPTGLQIVVQVIGSTDPSRALAALVGSTITSTYRINRGEYYDVRGTSVKLISEQEQDDLTVALWNAFQRQ
jgi:hypothetical protein